MENSTRWQTFQEDITAEGPCYLLRLRGCVYGGAVDVMIDSG